MAFFWIIIFFAALAVLVGGADRFLKSSEKIGFAFGLSPFLIGVLIVGIGTSLPELASSIVAVLQNAPEIVVANAVGSNIANILLVVGLAAVVGGGVSVTKNLIDVELPMLAVSTMIFLAVVFDGTVSIIEAVILVAAYLVYLFYSIYEKEEEMQPEDVPEKRPRADIADYSLLVLSAVALTLGAKYTIDAVIALSEIFAIAPAVVSITAVALGTSLPELLVSIKAARKGNAEVAVGNILGSNAFNALMVVGIPALIAPLALDEKTLLIGVPAMALATLIFVISGISRNIYRWEGMMFLLFYLMIVLNLFGLL